MDFEWLWYVTLGSSIVTNVPLWWGMLIMGKAMDIWCQRVYGKSLYLPLNFAVILKLLLKNSLIKSKETQEIFGGDGYVYYLDCGDGMMGVCLCPNSSKCIH